MSVSTSLSRGDFSNTFTTHCVLSLQLFLTYTQAKMFDHFDAIKNALKVDSSVDTVDCMAACILHEIF